MTQVLGDQGRRARNIKIKVSFVHLLEMRREERCGGFSLSYDLTFSFPGAHRIAASVAMSPHDPDHDCMRSLLLLLGKCWDEQVLDLLGGSLDKVDVGDEVVE